MRKTAALVIVALAGGIVTSACVTTRAQTPTQRPALEVPPVPPRVIEPVLPPEPTTIEPIPELPSAPSTTPPRPRPNPTRETARETKDAKPPETPSTETNPPPVAPPPQPVAPLRTGRTADGAKAEQQIRDIIGRANALLGKVDYRKLTPERRKAYDEAKQFAALAEAAIKDAKFDYAWELADKAETLAKELQG
jgi:outer membrane biosynthesis protein TonB